MTIWDYCGCDIKPRVTPAPRVERAIVAGVIERPTSNIRATFLPVARRTDIIKLAELRYPTSWPLGSLECGGEGVSTSEQELYRNNSEIDLIWERWQNTLEPRRDELNRALGQAQP